jgi:hypothetical protein
VAVGVSSYYFIDRHFSITALDEAGSPQRVPLIGSVDQVREILQSGVRGNPSQYLYVWIDKPRTR